MMSTFGKTVTAGLTRAFMRQSKEWTRAVAGVALLLFGSEQSASAATINVAGACNLVDAINAANSDSAAGGCPAGSGADVIDLRRTVTLTTGYGGGPTGLPDITSVVAIVGNNNTIQRAASAPSFRLLTVRDGGHLTLQNLTLRGGDGGEFGGGGVLTLGGTLTLIRCRVEENQAIRGGGIFGTFDGDAMPRISLSESTVTDNAAASDGGGVGLFLGFLTVTKSTIAGNTAQGFGGGIYSESSHPHLTDSTVTGNTAHWGGGIASQSLTTHNTADPNDLTLTNSTVAENAATESGGGVYLAVSNFTLTNSTVARNTAGMNGGGIAGTSIYDDLVLTYGTVAHNTAGVKGGGLSLRNGSGIRPEERGSTTLVYSLIAGNAAPSGREIASEDSAAVITGQYNLFGYTGDAGLQNVIPRPTDIIPVPGVLLPDILSPTLGNHGGPTRTLALVAGSPAVDAILSSLKTCDGADQRGILRPKGIGCDIGAFEWTPELCGNCIDDDGDGLIDLADHECQTAAAPLEDVQGSLTLSPVPYEDRVTLVTAFEAGPVLDPLGTGVTVQLHDDFTSLGCIRIPSWVEAQRGWTAKKFSTSILWRFKDTKDGALGAPSVDNLTLQCDTRKQTCALKADIRNTNLDGKGKSRPITTWVTLGKESWGKTQQWSAQGGGKQLVTKP